MIVERKQGAKVAIFVIVILILVGVGVILYNKHHSKQATNKTPFIAYSAPVSNYNGDNLFLVDFPCTPTRSVSNLPSQPNPDNVRKVDWYKEITYDCTTTTNADFSITVDYFPQSYGSQQMSDILHQYADDQINDTSYKDVSKSHQPYLGNDAFYIHYQHTAPFLLGVSGKLVYFDAVYFQKGALVYSLEIDNGSDTAVHNFSKSFRLE